MRIVTELVKNYNGPVSSLLPSAKMVEAYILGEDQEQPDAS